MADVLLANTDEVISCCSQRRAITFVNHYCKAKKNLLATGPPVGPNPSCVIEMEKRPVAAPLLVTFAMQNTKHQNAARTPLTQRVTSYTFVSHYFCLAGLANFICTI